MVKAKILDSAEQFENRKKGTVGLCSGCYDILQSGHAVFFEQCKEIADTLVVVVGSDIAIKKQKGPDRPINPQNNRVYLVAAMDDVDYAIIGEDELSPGKLDYVSIAEVIRPDFLILNDDDSAVVEKTKFCKEHNIEIRFVKRTVPNFLKPTSSTEIINKIGKKG